MSLGPTRILILGGGFGGVYTALILERLLRDDLRRGAVELALVNRENYMVFQPMLPEVISGSIGLVDTIIPIRRLCPNTNLYTRPIEKVDVQRRRVLTAAGLGTRPCELEYDHLVIALGNVTSPANLPGLAEHALPFKYLGDALTLRNRVIHTLEEADIEPDPRVRRALLTFVVAGGGFSGVEVAAELNDFVRAVARNFRHLNTGDIRVILVHAGELIFPELPRSLAEYAQRLLSKRGVEVRLRNRLAGATAEAALLEGGERIATRTLVSTVSSAPNPLVAVLPVKKERGRIVVDSHLAVPDHPGVWAVGDCAFVVDGGSGGAVPTDGPTRHPTGAAPCGKPRGHLARCAEDEVRVHSARRDGVARAPFRGGRDLRGAGLRVSRVVALADDVPHEAPRARPKDPSCHGLDPRSDPAPRHRPAHN